MSFKTIRRATLFIYGLFLVGFNMVASAQLLAGTSKTFTHADTLRGSLRPERTCYDVRFYELNLIIDTAAKSIRGSNKIFFHTIDDFQRLQLDLNDSMKIDKIIYKSEKLSFEREQGAVWVDFPETMEAGFNNMIEVFYHGKPHIATRPPWDGGFTWTKDETGKPWIAVSCEGVGASLWWPCKDHLSDEPDSMRIICTVPTGMICIANGNLQKEANYSDKTSTFTWFVSYPINNYDVSLNIGDYVHFEDEFIYSDGSKLPLDYYVLPYNSEKAHKQFEQVKPMLKCYEKYLGKYPFMRDGYALVETPYLGMEHQSAIAYGNKYKTGYNGNDFSRIGLTFDYIIIHETAHEWWGNSVTAKDLADMWIHESFCTYSESFYVECLYGYETAIKYINAKKGTVSNTAPIQGKYGVNNQGDGDMYAKGSLMLNTIRHVVNNDTLWFSAIKGLCDTAFKFKTVDANDVINYLNEHTGKDLAKIFEQYIKFAEIPVFVYSLTPVERDIFRLTYSWTSDVANFEMPVKIGTGKNESQILNCKSRRQITMLKLKKREDFKPDNNIGYFEVLNLDDKK